MIAVCVGTRGERGATVGVGHRVGVDMWPAERSKALKKTKSGFLVWTNRKSDREHSAAVQRGRGATWPLGWENQAVLYLRGGGV